MLGKVSYPCSGFFGVGSFKGNHTMLGTRGHNRVAKTLLNAFSNTTPPKWDEIVYLEGEIYDDVLDLRDRLAGMDWQQIGRNSGSVEKHRNDEFSFLTTVAMRYYLPGYLLACLKDPFAADVLLDCIMELLSQCAEDLSDTAAGQHHIGELVSSMTPAQVHAIAMFVEFAIQNYPEYFEDAGKILEYWHKRSGGHNT